MEGSEAPLVLNIVILIALVSVSLVYANNRRGSPIVAIFNRWLRWFLFAGAMALLLRDFGWSNRPFWVLALSAFLTWFLVETVFNWLAVQALSRSPVPLFPQFTEQDQPNEWPIQKRFLRLREWLRKNGFQQIQALKADLGFDVRIRNFVFESDDKKTRIQVLFIPRQNGNMTACFSFDSVSSEEIRFVTDNFYTPFGGFYPENWRLVRKIWTRGINRLHRAHQRRIAKAGAVLKEWEDESPLDDLNDQQRLIEQINTELGFLYPRHLHGEYGKITSEGCYRIWKEVWLLKYLGRSVSK